MEKFYKLLLAKLKSFGKKKTVNTGNTGLELSTNKELEIIKKMETLLYDNSFQINDYTDCGFYYSNGYWYKSNNNGKFIFLGKDINFEGENDFKA